MASSVGWLKPAHSSSSSRSPRAAADQRARSRWRPTPRAGRGRGRARRESGPGDWRWRGGARGDTLRRGEAGDKQLPRPSLAGGIIGGAREGRNDAESCGQAPVAQPGLGRKRLHEQRLEAALSSSSATACDFSGEPGRSIHSPWPQPSQIRVALASRPPAWPRHRSDPETSAESWTARRPVPVRPSRPSTGSLSSARCGSAPCECGNSIESRAIA